MGDFIFHALVEDTKGKSSVYRRSNVYRRKSNYYGTYKSPYYDPEARHERYMREKAEGKIKSASQSGASIGRSGGSSGGKSGKSGSSKSGRGSNNLAIRKLTEESGLNSDVQKEVARRKIEDLQNQLSDRIKELRKNAYDDSQSETNSAERRGIVQNLRNEIQSLQEKSSKEAERISKDLSSWISNEQRSLQKKIAALQGTKYDENADKVKEQQQKKRDKEVNSRADAIYKSKTKKK